MKKLEGLEEVRVSDFSRYWKEKKEKSGQLFNNQPLSSWEVHSFFH